MLDVCELQRLHLQGAKMNIWILVAVVCSMFGAVGQLFFKKGSETLVFSLELLKNWQLGLGLLLYAIATIGFILVLKNMKLSVAYPIIAFSYIFVALLSFFVLKEPFTAKMWIGTVVIVFGVVMIQNA